MNNYIKKRVCDEAKYILKNKGTVRSLSQIFNVSKSTVHYDLSLRLKKIDFDCYKKVRKILDTNFSERHIRGGIATKKMFQNKKITSKKIYKKI